MTVYERLIASKKVGNIFGIEVHITYALLFFIGIMSLFSLQGGLSNFLMTLVIYVALAVFVFLHEMGHSLTAIKEGAKVNSIYLHPLGGVANISGGLNGPASEIMIAAAGPFVSLLLAAVFYLPKMLFGGADTSSLLYYFFMINMMLAIFNMLPVFPLDGGRILTAILVMKMGSERALPLAVKIAKGGMIALGIIGLILMAQGSSMGLNLVLIAVLIYFIGNQEMQAMSYISSYTGGYGSYSGFSQPHRNKSESWLGKKISTWKENRRKKQEENDNRNREAVDNILRKVNEQGIGSLSPEERNLLNKASDELRRKNQ